MAWMYYSLNSIYYISIDTYLYGWILFSNYDVGTFKCVDY